MGLVSEVKTIAKSILENDEKYKIPCYQRNYSWEEKQCESLLNDIFKIKEENAKHFIGSFIMDVSFDKKKIILFLIL